MSDLELSDNQNINIIGESSPSIMNLNPVTSKDDDSDDDDFKPPPPPAENDESDMDSEDNNDNVIDDDDDDDDDDDINMDDDDDDDDDDEDNMNSEMEPSIKVKTKNSVNKPSIDIPSVNIDIPLQFEKNDSDYDSDSDEEEDDDYLQKFDSEQKQNYILNQHPECEIHNYNEIYNLSKVQRNKDNIIIDDLHKTIPILTKYEKTRILGIRAKQINSGAKPLVKLNTQLIDGYLIALKELEEKKIPVIIRRPIPNGSSEYWHLQDLEIIH
jgi:DNA-directed RNA polymerase I, II, and III subunit RPABC2